MSDRRRPDPQQGVFETLLIVDGRPVELDAHMARLTASLAALFPDLVAPDPRDEIEACARDVELGAVRATVAPAGATELKAQVELRRAAGPFMPLSGRKGPVQAVAVSSLTLAGGLGAHKWADRRLVDEAQSQLPADALPLVRDEDGAALEASRANVFAVRDGVLLTPPADGRLLPGITRARVTEIAATVELEVREAGLSGEDLLEADEVFLTGSVRGIERVRALDGTALAAGGKISSLLAAELRRTWAGVQVG